jgi:hypothetical protein
MLQNTSRIITTDFTSVIAAKQAKVGITPVQATAITDNAAAIINKIGKDGSPIAFDKASVLTAAAYTALATKVSTTYISQHNASLFR